MEDVGNLLAQAKIILDNRIIPGMFNAGNTVRVRSISMEHTEYAELFLDATAMLTQAIRRDHAENAFTLNAGVLSWPSSLAEGWSRLVVMVYTSEAHVSTVSNIPPLLAGMVLAAVTPEDPRIESGCRLAALEAILEDLFPQLEITAGQDSRALVIDPLQFTYWKRIYRLIPPWAAPRLVPRDGQSRLYMPVSTLEWGAFIWTTKNPLR
jgi:hypothetical protein